MPNQDEAPHDGAVPASVDVIVAGAGAIGLALSIALANAGLTVLCLGPAITESNGRTVALLDGSVRMLKAIGVWPSLAGRTAPLETMRLVDDTGSLFRVPPVDFVASEIGIEAFGHNVENADLVEVLASQARTTAGLHRADALLAQHHLTDGGLIGTMDDGRAVRAKLLIAADGAASPARVAAHIPIRETIYPQTALTTVLDHDRPHRNISTEFHKRGGPFTLVPLPPNERAANRSSLVWVMRPEVAAKRIALDPASLATAIADESRYLLGAVRVPGRVGAFPLRRIVAQRLVGPRLALAGEAAHALPPIGAQGLNLSFRDAATLVDCLGRALARGEDPGSPSVLDGYERARAGDIALRATGVDTLNNALISDLLPVDLVRGAGLVALSALPALRRAVMRQGLRPQHAIPSLMR